MPNEDERPAAGEPNPDDEATDLSLGPIPAIALHRDSERSPIAEPPASTPFDSASAEAASIDAAPGYAAPPIGDEPRGDPERIDPPAAAVEEESPWRFNALGAVLLTALICTLTVGLALLLKLHHLRANLAEMEDETEAAAVELAARQPQPRRAADVTSPAGQGEQQAAGEVVGNDGHEQLLLLLTVGTKHYADKQLVRMKEHCAAKLAVYRQTRGRCAWEECFVVAVPAAEAEVARGCGQGTGHTLRDREDFVLP